MTPEELRVTLKQRLAREPTDRHWSVVAPLLRRVDQERLWEAWGYGSMRQFAEEELGLEGYALVRYLELGALAAALEGRVAAGTWRRLAASRARELVRLRALGLDEAALAPWVERAVAAPTTDAFRAALADHLGTAGETFVRWTVRVPASMLPLLRAAMVLALPAATGDPAAPAERAEDPDVAFRCLEQIVATYCAAAARSAGGGGGPDDA